MAHPRKFDHEEMLALYGSGEWTQERLAARYGVSPSAISQAISRGTDPAWRAVSNAYHRRYQRQHLRQPCVAGCGRLAWPNRSGRCRECAARARATTVRDDALLCRRCGEWKPDEAFPAEVAAKARRGRHQLCRPCQTAAKRDWRARRSVAA